MKKLEKLTQAIFAVIGMTIGWAIVGLAIWYFSFWANVTPIFELGPKPFVIGGAIFGFIASVLAVVAPKEQ